MTSWLKKFKEVIYDEHTVNYVIPFELLKYKQAIIPASIPEPIPDPIPEPISASIPEPIPEPIPDPIPEPILVPFVYSPLPMYEQAVRPGTAPTPNYNPGTVQLIKYRRYNINNRPSTR